MDMIVRLAEELSLRQSQVESTVRLIDEGNTIPFIARYRKEVTGNLDDTTLRALEDRLKYLRSLETRRGEIRCAIEAQGKMTDDLATALEAAETLTAMEDIYRPYRQKRRTRASVARERGLAPLAALLREQRADYGMSIEALASSYVNEEAEVATPSDALDGACDIIAEEISDDADCRREVRALTMAYGMLLSKKKKEEPSVYENYYDYHEKPEKIPGHRILALNRGEKEDFLNVSVSVDRDIILNALFARVIAPTPGPARNYVMRAMVDGYDRLMAPSIEREIRAELLDRASEGAIKLFAENLKHLLMQPPVHGHVVLGLDPGYRTGCKLAVVDATGKVLDTAVIYPTKPHERIEEAKGITRRLIERHGVTLVAIGNGTASGESECFIASLLHEIPGDIRYAMVSEAGASVYSASVLGAEEFPDFDVTQRSAVSIARRLQDPLAELVKIEPKAIGVGQYQHDMKQSRLEETLGGVVEDCVNAVGVDVNTASYSLLSYVAGIGLSGAKNIVKYRETHGAFTCRAQILQVPRIGARAYEQCAGFLRVPSSDEIFDCTGVHPESYSAARRLLSRFSLSEEDVRENRVRALWQEIQRAGVQHICEEIGVGEPTLRDIVEELEKPGRDVRETLPPPELRSDVMSLSDLRPDMVLTGTVRNVIDFGAFVDIGVHQDGLVHISQMSDRFVGHPSEVLAVGDRVRVRVLSVDTAKKRIALSMKL